MMLTYGLVSDQTEENVPFFVDPKWSSGASAVASLNKASDTISFKLTARTLDSVIPRELVRDQRLLFKMDIEGYESRAFGGFGETLDAAALAVGFIEFDSRYTTAAGELPEVYFRRLAQRFDIYRLDASSARVIIRVGNYSTLPRSRSSDGRIHTDLILITQHTAPATWLTPGWALR